MKNNLGYPALLTVLPFLFQSVRSLPQLQARDNANCKVAFQRLSRQDASSWLASVEHTIYLPSDEPDKPGVPIAMSSCWTAVGWGSGCGWGRAETTQIDKGWGVQHEGYTTWKDYNADVQIHGNGCEGTVLKCKGTHSGYTIPDPVNGGGKYWAISDSKCALAGENVDTYFNGSLEGTELLDLLKKEGNTEGFNGDLSSLKTANVPAPGPYTCEKFSSSESVCTPFWECVDKAASITAYFPGTATFASTMSTQPTIAPIASPSPCNTASKCNCNEDGCSSDSPACCANGTC